MHRHAAANRQHAVLETSLQLSLHPFLIFASRIPVAGAHTKRISFSIVETWIASYINVSYWSTTSA